jgi:hypothetical protein
MLPHEFHIAVLSDPRSGGFPWMLVVGMVLMPEAWILLIKEPNNVFSPISVGRGNRKAEERHIMARATAARSMVSL